MADPFVGEIRAFTFTFAPVDWVYCDGSILPTSQYQALETIIGSLYGGNTSNFAVPNLHGRTIKGASTVGTQPTVGVTAGVETVTLTSAQVAPHQHTVNGYVPGAGISQEVNTPVATSTLSLTQNQFDYSNPAQAINPWVGGTGFAPAVISSALGNGTAPVAAHENRQPYTVFNYCICTTGEYPIRP